MQALMIAAPMLGLIGLGVACVGLFGRDPHADEHEVTDYYRPAIAVARRNWPLLDVGPRRLCPGAALDILPPAPSGVRVSLPLYAEQVVAERLRERFGTTSPDVIAARMLREIGADEQDKAGIGPAHEHWVHWDGTCDLDCPACARDMTGAFPVVRAA